MPAWGYTPHPDCDESDDQQDAEILAIELFQKPCSPFELKFNFTGAEHSLVVTWADRIGDVKKKLSLNFGVATRIQRLIVNSQEVHDNQKLRHVMVGGPCPVEFRLNLNKIIKLLVRTLAGKTIELQCADSSTIYDVKNMVEDKAGIPVNHQRLLFKREDLDDDVKLPVCGLHDGDVVHLILKLKAQDWQL